MVRNRGLPARRAKYGLARRGLPAGRFPFQLPVGAEACRPLSAPDGLGPSDNIDANDLAHEKVKSSIEDYRPDRRFDLITLSMVAEHITNPLPAMQS
jgi:hypothetical protein